MYLGIIIIALFLSGCDTVFAPPPKLDFREKPFIISVKETDDLPPNVFGTATWVEGANTCLIKLKKYLIYLLHEIRHCLEGSWHKEK